MRYTVKQASSLTGITPDRLRAWERRYGIVTPDRTEARYRLYDDADLARLRLMVRLVEAGTPASLAADEVRAAYADLSVNGHPSPAPSAIPPASALAVEALIEPAGSLDRAELEQLLDRAFASDSFEAVAERWLLPALNALGQAWHDGRIDVAGEHFVSSAVRRRLARAFDAAGSTRSGPEVIVGLPPDALHELGALTFSTCLRRLGVDVRWLGSDLPVESWAHAVSRIKPVAVVVSVPTEKDLPAAVDVVNRLSHGDAHLLLGGRGAAGLSNEPTVHAGFTLLPFSVVESAQLTATRVAGVA